MNVTFRYIDNDELIVRSMHVYEVLEENTIKFFSPIQACYIGIQAGLRYKA